MNILFLKTQSLFIRYRT